MRMECKVNQGRHTEYITAETGKELHENVLKAKKRLSEQCFQDYCKTKEREQKEHEEYLQSDEYKKFLEEESEEDEKVQQQAYSYHSTVLCKLCKKAQMGEELSYDEKEDMKLGYEIIQSNNIKED